jgi:hypothetical protein
MYVVPHFDIANIIKLAELMCIDALHSIVHGVIAADD